MMLALCVIGYFVIAIAVAYLVGSRSLFDPDACAMFGLVWPLAIPILLLHYAASCGENNYKG